MGTDTNIPWAHHTWNPWWGCRKVSDECLNCYIARAMARTPVPAFSGAVRTGQPTWRKPLAWNLQAIDQLKTTRVFTCSMSDFFHPDADPWRNDAWRIMQSCFALTWLVLTKRPERIADCLPSNWGNGYMNVWLGVSVGSQQHIGRIETLAGVPARLRFLSAEPLFEFITLSDHIEYLDWVIVGGESGAGFRPSNVQWYESLCSECRTAGVPFYMKQDAGSRPDQQGRIPDDLWAQRHFPKAR